MKKIIIFLFLIFLTDCGMTFQEYVRWTLDTTEVKYITVIDQNGKSEFKTVIINDLNKQKGNPKNGNNN